MNVNPPSRRNLAACFGAMLLVSGCGEGGGTKDSVVVRDSAGIQIVENTGAGAWDEGDGWRLSEQPTLRIGQAEGAENYQFVRIASVLRRPDGVIAVADAGQHLIRFYDRAGTFIRAVGGKGEGPGEFQHMASNVQVLGDSLMTYDLQLQRFSFFAGDGTLAGTMPFAWKSPGFPRPLRRLSDGSVFVSLGPVYSPGQVKDGLSRDPVSFLRATVEGRLLDTVATLPGSEQFVEADEGSGSITVVGRLFGRYPVAAVSDSQVALGSNEAYEVGVYSPAGALRRLIRRRQDPRPVTDGDWDALVRQQLEDLDGGWRTEVEGMYRKMPRPREMPFYTEALFDEAGNLWLEDFRAPSDTVTRWTVFEPGGRMLGGVAVPEGFRPTHIGRDFVLGVEKDDMDVEYVREYRLIKGASQD